MRRLATIFKCAAEAAMFDFDVTAKLREVVHGE